MPTKTERYWAWLRTFIPGRYKIRTALTPNYVLQVTGWENGHRHRTVLYFITAAGNLRRVWSHPIWISNPGGQKPAYEIAKNLAFENLRDMLRGSRRHARYIPTCTQIEQELIDTVNKILEDQSI